uniref:restriction endonuclease subunit S n=1 Tax=uncultured Halomonas sp. TaxID=173971 RepID=UPI00262CD617
MIPEGWRLVSLGDCFEFKNGINADKDSYGHGVKFVNVMDVFASRELRYENLINSVSVTDKQKKDYSVLRGDVLFNRTSEVVEEIAFASVYCDDEPAVFGGFVIRGRRKGQSISERFSVYLFGSSSFRRQAIKSCQGVVRGNIGQKDLAKISLYLPPLNEQKKIASILSTWDEAITTSERLIEASQQQRHALMQQLLTGKRRLPGFAVHAGWRHEKYGDVPNDWGFVEIGSFSRQSSGKNRETEELPVLSCSKYDGFVDSLSYFNKRVYSEDLSGYKVIYRGDIGFPSNHVEAGSIGL